MSYRLSITRKPTYLHATVTGTNSEDNVARYLGEIRRECAGRGCFQVLIEERLDGPRLGTMSVFRIAAEGSSRAEGQFKAIAYVDVNAKGKLMAFAETVAVNRGLPVRVFASVAEAEKWLLGKDGGDG
jgi:hypothetical protein